MRIGEPAVASLKRFIEDLECSAVGMALDVLVEICGEAVFGYIVDLLETSCDPRLRSVCTGALGRLGTEEVVAALGYALGDPVFFVRCGAVESLAGIRDSRVVGLLVRGLYDKHHYVNLYAVLVKNN